MKRKLIKILFLCFIINFNVQAEDCPFKINISPKRKLISVDFMTNEHDNYSKKSYAGRISHLDINSNTGDIDGLELTTKNGIKEFFNVPDGGCINSMSQADKSWIYELLNEGAKVKVVVYFQGNAGLPVVKRILPYN